MSDILTSWVLGKGMQSYYNDVNIAWKGTDIWLHAAGPSCRYRVS